MPAPAYRYLLTDLLTDQVLAHLPLSGVGFERRISRTGDLQATLNAPTPQLVTIAKFLYTNVGRCALWVYRDNEIWWGGIPWTFVPQQGQRGAISASLAAATFDSYAHHRQLYADLTFDQTDAGVIVPTLWRTIQADPRGNIGVQALNQPVGGTLLDREYLVADQAYVGQMIEDIGDLAGGPEHTIDTYLDPDGTRRKRLRLAPRLGLDEPRTVFQRAVRGGGRLLEWTHTADSTGGAKAGTTFQVRGDTSSGSDTALSDRILATDLLTAGWPLLDVTDDRAGETETDALNGYARALATQRPGALRTHAYTVQVGDTGWSPNRLGDPVRIKQTDAWHTQPDETDVVVRPVGVKVTAASRDTAETVQLLFGDD